jgi:hypothetical protein
MYKLPITIVFIFSISSFSFSQPSSPCDSYDPFSAKYDSCIEANSPLGYLTASQIGSNKEYMTVLPNPNSGEQLNINIFDLNANNIRLEILNLSGEVVYQQVSKGINTRFFSVLTDISRLRLPNGMYAIRCFGGEKMLVERLLINK